ncbi:MAG: hypothetical protein CMI35_17770 [Owenweeksia sp.]|nr:hypothetical protein [Owenweeksia sp.]|tara:strand:+ start:4468 stop:5358 length:891 start_codon:yes stop_codon:yes gene_type:complete
MAKRLRFAALAASLLLIVSCSRESFEATTPAYLHIPSIQVDSTFYPTQGSAHSAITTAWIYANGKAVGVFELPATVPVPNSGPTLVEVYPGITMNGIGATRAIYTPYQVLRETLDLTELDTLELDSPYTRYASSATILQVETFDENGLNLTATNRSDTSVIKTNDPGEIFVNPEQAENNGRAGKIVLEGERNFFELESSEAYSLPTYGISVYLEMTYKTEVPMVVGVVANYPGGITQRASTLVLLPNDEWKKIYVNLVTELTAYSDAIGFQILIAGQETDSEAPHKILLDNLKIVY